MTADLHDDAFYCHDGWVRRGPSMRWSKMPTVLGQESYRYKTMKLADNLADWLSDRGGMIHASLAACKSGLVRCDVISADQSRLQLSVAG